MSFLVDNIIIFSSCLFWVIVDNVTILKNDRIVNSGLIHAIVSGVSGNIGCALYPLLMYDYPLVKETIPYPLLIGPLISIGYSGYDLYIGFKHNRMDEIIHGFLFLYGSMIAYKHGIVPTLNIFGLTETSSIFLHIRPFNQQWINIMFIVTFFSYRVIICPILLIIYVLNEENVARREIFVGGGLLTLLNIYWFHLIMKKAIHLMKNK
jgi:hypothetical protein